MSGSTRFYSQYSAGRAVCQLSCTLFIYSPNSRAASNTHYAASSGIIFIFTCHTSTRKAAACNPRAILPRYAADATLTGNTARHGTARDSAFICTSHAANLAARDIDGHIHKVQIFHLAILADITEQAKTVGRCVRHLQIGNGMPAAVKVQSRAGFSLTAWAHVLRPFSLETSYLVTLPVSSFTST